MPCNDLGADAGLTPYCNVLQASRLANTDTNNHSTWTKVYHITMTTTALIIVDMQNAFSSMVEKAVPNIQNLHRYFLQTSRPIIFTQHGHSKEELTPPFKNQVVRRWGAEGSIARGSHSWNFIPGIQDLVDAGGDVLQGKNTYDSFINTNLASLLEENNIERVVVCGVMTDACCDTTARSAANRGYETWLVSDACGSANKKQHDAGLTGFSFLFEGVMTTEQAILELDGE